jgi:hypothetical protein
MEKHLYPNANKSSNLLRWSALLTLADKIIIKASFLAAIGDNTGREL